MILHGSEVRARNSMIELERSFSSVCAATETRTSGFCGLQKSSSLLFPPAHRSNEHSCCNSVECQQRQVDLLHPLDLGLPIFKFTSSLQIIYRKMKLPIAATLLLLGGANAFAPSTPAFARQTSALNAVSKKDSYSVTLLPGDGIGPEITAATKDVLAALCERCGFEMELKEALIGGSAIDEKNDPFPEESLEQCRNSDSVLLACIGGYKWDSNPRELRPETGLLKMRKEMGLFANLRPAKVLPQLIDASTLKREVVEGVDVMVVRELTGDVYFGTPKGIDVVDGERVGYNNMIYAEHEIERIARVAGDVASKRDGKLCSVDKANVLDVSQLWREVVTDVITKDFSDVELSHMYVDNAAMQLIRWPKQFDTIVCGNIFGDILSDEASMLVGSLGMLPSASIGESGPGVFEPCHGSAPDIAGENKANPLAMILSAAMMLKYDLDRPEEAALLEAAVEAALDQNLRTPDIKQEGDGCEEIGCTEMGKAVAELVSTIDMPAEIAV